MVNPESAKSWNEPGIFSRKQKRFVFACMLKRQKQVGSVSPGLDSLRVGRLFLRYQLKHTELDFFPGLFSPVFRKKEPEFNHREGIFVIFIRFVYCSSHSGKIFKIFKFS